MERVDTTDWSQQQKADWAEELMQGEGGANQIARIEMDAIDGELDDTPRTIVTRYHGDTKAAALARGYKVRDIIERETDLDASCEMGDTMWTFEDIPDYYEIKLHIEGGE